MDSNPGRAPTRLFDEIFLLNCRILRKQKVLSFKAIFFCSFSNCVSLKSFSQKIEDYNIKMIVHIKVLIKEHKAHSTLPLKTVLFCSFYCVNIEKVRKKRELQYSNVNPCIGQINSQLLRKFTYSHLQTLIDPRNLQNSTML